MTTDVAFNAEIGAAGAIRQEYLALCVRLKSAERNAVTVYLKGNIREILPVGAGIFENTQASLRLVRHRHRDRAARCDLHRLHSLRIGFPALDTRDLAYLIGRGAQLVKESDAACTGLFGVNRAARNVLDLHRHTGKCLAGVAALLHAQIAAGGIFVCDNSGLAVQNGDVLRRLRRERVPFRRGDFLDRIMSHDVNRNRHGAVRAG